MHRTTSTLRESLFNVIDKISSGEMSPEDGKAICEVSKQIIESARLEMEYTNNLNSLDKIGSDLSPGPILLTEDAVESSKDATPTVFRPQPVE